MAGNDKICFGGTRKHAFILAQYTYWPGPMSMWASSILSGPDQLIFQIHI